MTEMNFAEDFCLHNVRKDVFKYWKLIVFLLQSEVKGSWIYADPKTSILFGWDCHLIYPVGGFIYWTSILTSLSSSCLNWSHSSMGSLFVFSAALRLCSGVSSA